MTAGGYPRVLFVADHFAFPGGVTHGLTTYYATVLPRLVAEGVDVSAVFLREAGDSHHTLGDAGVEVLGYRSSRWSLTGYRRLVGDVRRLSPHVLHTAQVKATLFGRLAGCVTRTPVIVHLHDEALPPPALRLAMDLLDRPTDLALLVSGEIAPAATVGYRIPPQRQRTLHTGIDLGLVQRHRAHRLQLRRDLLDVHDDRVVVGMVGRFHPVKGHRNLIRLFGGLRAGLRGALLVLVGDGEERAACEALVTDLGLRDLVRFLGQRPDVAQLVNCFDLVVQPSTSEGLPLSLIESLAAGVPAIAFDVGGVADVITDGGCGLLVPAGDGIAFGAALQRLVGDADLRRRLGAQARHRSAAFSLDGHVRALVRLYRLQSTAALTAWSHGA
jgi:glycosyltransferase involved in cell wall biosynthesis